VGVLVNVPLVSVLPEKHGVGSGSVLTQPRSPLVLLPKNPLPVNLLLRIASPN